MTAIREIMSSPVVSLAPDDTVAHAIKMLTQQHTGGLPVVDRKGQVIGMISELAMIDVAFDRNVRHAPVSRYMSRDVHVVQADESLLRAAQMFALYSFRRLPVVEDGKLVGVITRRDLLNHAIETEELLAEPLMELISSLAPLS